MTTEVFHPKLMLVTDRVIAGGEDALVEKIALAVEGGADWVQVREKDLDETELGRLVRRVADVVGERAKVVVNGSVCVAEECGADGVHLPENDDMVHADGMVVGRSVHSSSAACIAEDEGVDYIVAGPLFPTATHAGMNPLGVGLISDIAELVSVPVIGIGGITEQRAAGVIAAGASGVAVVRAVLGARDARQAAHGLRRVIEEAKAG
jgi:thiamine-phosphate pyrophosphorylase